MFVVVDGSEQIEDLYPPAAADILVQSRRHRLLLRFVMAYLAGFFDQAIING